MATQAYRATIASVLGAALLVQTAFAQVNPPSWWDVDDGMTSSLSWTFDTDAFPPEPTINLAPFGAPEWNKDDGVSWFDTVNGHDGVWGVGPGGLGSLGVKLRNVRVPWQTKHMFLQVDFFEEFGSDVWGILTVPPGSFIHNLHESDVDLEGGWRRATVTYDICPQPGWERADFVFASLPWMNRGAYIDNLYVGSHCNVPSPAALLPFVLGAVVAFRRRRR